MPERVELDAKAELILAQLELRFGALPPRVVRRVRRGTRAELRRWAARVILLPTLRDVIVLGRDTEPDTRPPKIMLERAAQAPEALRAHFAGLFESIREQGSIPGDWIRGEQFGKANARLEGEASLLLHLLRLRFGRVPKRIADRIECWVALGNAEALYGCAEQAFDAATLDELAADD